MGFVATQDSFWTEEAMEARHEEMFERLSKIITLQSIRKVTRMPEPYDQTYRRTITKANPGPFPATHLHAPRKGGG